MATSQNDVCESVAKCACLFYCSLSKNGKPVNNQWTSMAAVVMFNPLKETDKFSVVSLGTGTKCLGQKEISANGELVTDSHAEVVARRAFLCYLYEQLKLCRDKDKNSIFKINKSSKTEESAYSVTLLEEVAVRNDIQFHLFVSHVPCGDAAIFPNKTEIISEPSVPKKAKVSVEEHVEIQHRTGAKLQVGAKHYEEEFQEPGKCRIKGGKGDPTLCMSCSDKMFKWQLMGFQGSLLANFIKEPIRMSSVVVGAGVPCDYEAFERAIYMRFRENVVRLQIFEEYPKFLDNFTCPLIFQSSVNFMELGNAVLPAPASIISYQLLNGKCRTQVSVNGRKHGVTKKMKGKSALLDICRVNLFQLFRSLSSSKCTSYQECKLLNSVYYNIWSRVKNNVLKGWTEKPEIMLQFEG